MKKIALSLIFVGFTTLAMADGAELFKKCAGCHGANGHKKALGKSAVIAGQSMAKTIKQLKEYRAGTLNLYKMGTAMKGQVDTMSDADIKAVAEYISTLK